MQAIRQALANTSRRVNAIIVVAFLLVAGIIPATLESCDRPQSHGGR